MPPSLSYPAGLCPDCLHSKAMTSDRGSTFLLCQLAFADPRFPKYPRLPVLHCAGFAARPHSSAPTVST